MSQLKKKKDDQLIRGVALFDAHFGWEWATVAGKTVKRATHCMPAIRATLEFIQDWKPNAVVLGGDQLNCGPISHWHHGKPRLTEQFRLKEEMEALNDIFLGPLEGIVPKRRGNRIWHDGNHEAWIFDHVLANPGVEGLIEPAQVLKLESRGWQQYSQGEISRFGKLYFVHGDVVLGRGSYVSPAKKLVTAYRRNIRAGHLHTYDAATEELAVDRRDYHTGVIVPSLSSRSPVYCKNNPNKFMNGFLVFEVDARTGNFSDYVIIVGPDGFRWEGKHYVR